MNIHCHWQCIFVLPVYMGFCIIVFWGFTMLQGGEHVFPHINLGTAFEKIPFKKFNSNISFRASETQGFIVQQKFISHFDIALHQLYQLTILDLISTSIDINI